MCIHNPLYQFTLMKKSFKSTYTSEQLRELHEKNHKELELRIFGLIVDMCKKVSCVEFGLLSVNPTLTGKVMSDVVRIYVRSGQMN